VAGSSGDATVSWLPWRRRQPPVFEDRWRPLLADHLAVWAELDDATRHRLEDLTARFLVDKHWEAARGFEVTEEMRVVVSAHACTLVLGLDLDHYRYVHTVIVHPSAQTQRGERSVGGTSVRTNSPRRIHGRTGRGRPVALAWDAIRREGPNPGRGLNVVHHEFAHQLDLIDGLLDGTPPIDDEHLRRRWVEVCTARYEEVRSGPLAPLRAYAGENPAEFFAVSTEVFLARPVDLEQELPDLYGVLREFYRQDPAGRRPAGDAG
jgi:MtfA peptidase